jgi:putative nucleotidyltransferase with HDIG domain
MSKEALEQSELAKQIEAYAVKYLSQGRIGWDVPHTYSVVHYAGEIADSVGVDHLVATTAAWFHDIGYFGLFINEDSNRHESVIDKKAQHMEEGARLVREFLEQPGITNYFTPEQRERVIHLVSVHDKVADLKDLDELVLMEADTLGAIDITRVTPTFDYDSGMKYIEGLKRKRLPRFCTDLGKKHAGELLPRFEQFFAEKR